MSEVMREYVSRQYGGDWPQKVAKMPDYQVASIYHRLLDRETRIAYGQPTTRKELKKRRHEQE